MTKNKTLRMTVKSAQNDRNKTAQNDKKYSE